MVKTIASLEELHKGAKQFIDTLIPHNEHAMLVTLSGELGAGKTAFTKALGEVLEVGETVTSPTFIMMKVYETQRAWPKRLVHIDAYRLTSGTELTPLRFDELYADKENLIVLEWPEQVKDTLSAADVAITLSLGEGESRTITYG